MKLKYNFIFLMVFNYLILGTIKAFSDHWEDSEPWKEYLESLRLNRSHQNIINQNDYCELVKDYQASNPLKLGPKGIPLQKVVFSDFSHKSFPHKVLKNYTDLVLLEHFTRMHPKLHPYEQLPPNISIFFHHEVVWHKYHKIGEQFLCQGQRYNHIPGNIYLSFKDTTINNFIEYQKHNQEFKPWEVMPKSWDLSDLSQCKDFFSVLQKDAQETFEGVKYVVKKSRYSHNGEGITLIDLENAKIALKEFDNGNKCYEAAGFLAQTYISSPFLINNKKFDFRVYMLIANLDPLIILYHDGFVRISLDDYDQKSSNVSKHLTNLEVAEGYLESSGASQEEWEEALVDQGWSFQRFQEYMESNGYVPKGWVQNQLKSQMKQTMYHLVMMNMKNLLKHPGVFEYFGLDFILDSDLHLWYLELNLTPCITEKNALKRELNTKFIQSILDLEYTLMYDGDFEGVLSESNFETVYDGRK